MSVQAISWVFDHSESELAARHVLLSIANHADKFGQNSWPSFPTISQEARVSEKTVQRSIKELMEMGELSVNIGAGPHRSNLYSLCKMQGDNLSGIKVVKEDILSLSGGHPVPRNKEEPSLTVLKNTSPSSKKIKSLTQNQQIYEFIKAGYERKRLTLTWGPAEWKQLALLIKECPSIVEIEFLRRCLNNRFKSEKINPVERPCQWLRKLPNYELGPLNEFGKLTSAPMSLAEDTTHYA